MGRERAARALTRSPPRLIYTGTGQPVPVTGPIWAGFIRENFCGPQAVGRAAGCLLTLNSDATCYCSII